MSESANELDIEEQRQAAEEADRKRAELMARVPRPVLPGEEGGADTAEGQE